MVHKTGSGINTNIPAVKQKPSWTSQKEKAKNSTAASFHQVLDEVKHQRKLTFSAHARERIESRKIEFSSKDLLRMEEALDEVTKKGGRSSLLLFDHVALLASGPNRTIITAVDSTQDKEQFFTGIDSAVIFK